MANKPLMTTVENLKLETEISEWLRMGSELRVGYIAGLMTKLEACTYVTVTTVVEVSKKLEATKAYWTDQRENYDEWEKKLKNRNTMKVVIHRKGRNKLTLVRQGSRFVVNSI